jgi:hypothetical protein
MDWRTTLCSKYRKAPVMRQAEWESTDLDAFADL